jgi:hypothetical protein
MTDNEHIAHIMGSRAARERAIPLAEEDRVFMAFLRANRHLSVLPLMQAWETGYRTTSESELVSASAA